MVSVCVSLRVCVRVCAGCAGAARHAGPPPRQGTHKQTFIKICYVENYSRHTRL